MYSFTASVSFTSFERFPTTAPLAIVLHPGVPALCRGQPRSHSQCGRVSRGPYKRSAIGPPTSVSASACSPRALEAMVAIKDAMAMRRQPRLKGSPRAAS